MNNLHHHQRPHAVLAMAALAATAITLGLGSGTAMAQTPNYSGTGIVEPTAPPVGTVQSMLATSANGYTLNGLAGWSLHAPFDFDFSGSGIGSFTLARGSDLLAGTLTTGMVAPDSFTLNYTVTRGQGSYASVTGGGGSTVVTLTGNAGASGFFYQELGQLSLVPEPASWLMLLAGVALLIARQQHGGRARQQG